MKTVLDIQKINKVESYPYGRLRTQAFFSIEFKPKKGFRSVFQTINPKTGRLNAPKCGTYKPFMCVQHNYETGHLEFYSIYDNGFTAINKYAEFIAAHPEMNLTPAMVQEICAYLFTMIKGNAKYSGLPFASLQPIIDTAVKILIAGFKTGEINFSDVHIDTAAIEKIKGAEPVWKFQSTEPISILDM